MGETISADLVWHYRRDIERLASVLCKHREDAEDVSQASLLKAATHINGFRGEASIRTWLHRVATNECAMRRRRKPHPSFEGMVSEGWNHPSDDHGPERLALDSESKREVLQAVSSLPHQYRCVLLLKDGEGLPLKTVASILGTTVPSVKSTLHRARRRLRESLSA